MFRAATENSQYRKSTQIRLVLFSMSSCGTLVKITAYNLYWNSFWQTIKNILKADVASQYIFWV